MSNLMKSIHLMKMRTSKNDDEDYDGDECEPDVVIRAKWMLDNCGSFEEVMLCICILVTHY